MKDESLEQIAEYLGAHLPVEEIMVQDGFLFIVMQDAKVISQAIPDGDSPETNLWFLNKLWKLCQ